MDYFTMVHAIDINFIVLRNYVILFNAILNIVNRFNWLLKLLPFCSPCSVFNDFPEKSHFFPLLKRSEFLTLRLKIFRQVVHY